MATGGLLDIEVRYLDERASPVIGRLAEVDPDLIVTGRPVRRFPVYKNQSNYPGWLWSSTMGRLIGYESLLERDRVWLADFDPAVQAIARSITSATSCSWSKSVPGWSEVKSWCGRSGAASGSATTRRVGRSRRPAGPAGAVAGAFTAEGVEPGHVDEVAQVVVDGHRALLLADGVAQHGASLLAAGLAAFGDGWLGGTIPGSRSIMPMGGGGCDRPDGSAAHA